MSSINALRPPTAAEARAIARSWQPSKTPRLSLGIVLWAVGLYAALYATPSPVSKEQLGLYRAKLREADALLPQLARHNEAFNAVQADEWRERPWLWQLSPAASARVKVARKVVARERAALRVVQRKYEEKLRLARRELGLWSDVGVSEVRHDFWTKYEGGKRFAMRQTWWDVIMVIINGSTGTDRSVAEFVLHFIGIVVANLTAGMLSAILFFLVSLPGIIWSFGASIWSGLLFFVVASVAASAVTATALGGLYGTAGVAVYYTHRIAGNQARLAAAREAEARRLRRAHAD